MNRKDRRAGLPQGQGRPAAISADRLFKSAYEHHAAGRMAEAEQFYREALALDPRHADSLNGLGILAHQCGHSDAALDFIGQAIAADGRNAQYHYNLGLVCAALGNMDAAVTHNRRAVMLKPDYADAHTNLAGALAAQGHHGEAALHLRRVLARRADQPLAYNNLATALLAAGDAQEALGVAVRGLAIKTTDELKLIFVRCVENVEAPPKLPGLAAFVERALAEGWARPEVFTKISAELVKQNAVVAALIERIESAAARSEAIEAMGPQGLAAIAGDRLLRRFMTLAPVCDVGLERMLTTARLAMFDLAALAPASDVSDDVLDFALALAQQCFINEYVFDCGRDEQDRARALRERLAAAMASDDIVPALMIAAVAAYFPLYSLDVAPERFERPWAGAGARLIKQQIHEPAEEQALRSTIPALTPIDDSVSVEVRQQYEENPYPRWTATVAGGKPVMFGESIASEFPNVAFKTLDKTNVDILIAGCGTGRHAIDTYRRYRGARMLAVDLSLASLSYAKRKARELGAADIEFGQADILKLGSLGRTFDVIESVGVLHHMRDPMEGWRVLVDVLRPGGFMRIGLYSALARQYVSAARAFIAERGYGPAADGVRQCRQDILNLEAGALVRDAVQAFDFFTTSECRDLMFHVQEHQMSIPGIKSFIEANRLLFLGFAGPARHRYAEVYPDDSAMTDLDRWQAFELGHPTAFFNMYNFWLQKPAV